MTDSTSLSADQLLQKIETAYAKLVRLYRSVPVNAVMEESLQNGWSVKDVLGHIAAWEWRCVAMLSESHVSDLPLEADPDVDALNREIYEERKEWSWEEVEYDFRAAHEALIRVIKDVPADRLADPIVQETIAEETWEHYAEHLDEIKDWHQRVTRKRNR